MQMVNSMWQWPSPTIHLLLQVGEINRISIYLSLNRLVAVCVFSFLFFNLVFFFFYSFAFLCVFDLDVHLKENIQM